MCTVVFTHRCSADRELDLGWFVGPRAQPGRQACAGLEELDEGWLAGLREQPGRRVQNLYSGLVVPLGRLSRACCCLESRKLSRVMMAEPHCWTVSGRGHR